MIGTLQKVARALSGKYDVEVISAGNKAYTDGRKIVIPALPEKLDETTILMARAYVDHENGHVENTDMVTMKDVIGDNTKLHTVWNYVEDIVIESRQSRKYYGSKINMEGLTNNLLNFCDTSNILMKIFVEGRRQNAGYDIPSAPSFKDEIENIFGDGFFGDLDALTQIEDNTERTLGCIAKAEEIIRLYDEFRKENPPESKETKESDESSTDEESNDSGTPDPFDDSESSTDKDGGESEDSSEKSEDDSEDKDSEGEGIENGEKLEDGGESEDYSMGSGSGEAIGGGEAEIRNEVTTTIQEIRADISDLDTAKNPYDMVKEFLESKNEEAFTANKYMVYDKQFDSIKNMDEAANTIIFDKLKSNLGTLNVLKAKVATLFLAKTQSRWINDRETGRINSRALAKIKSCNNRLFREKFESKERDMAISFLVDFSGSMQGMNLKAAMEAVVCFLEVLEGSKIKTEVLTYTTGGLVADLAASEDYRSVKRHDPNRWEYGRTESLDTKIIKGFDDVYGKKVKARISNYINQVNANNCDGDSVMVAYERIRSRPEKRKILFVLTDGCVCNNGNNTAGKIYLKEVCKDIEKAGKVELIGIGLGESKVKKYYKKFFYVDPYADKKFSESLFEELRKILSV